MLCMIDKCLLNLHREHSWIWQIYRKRTEETTSVLLTTMLNLQTILKLKSLSFSPLPVGRCRIPWARLRTAGLMLNWSALLQVHTSFQHHYDYITTIYLYRFKFLQWISLYTVLICRKNSCNVFCKMQKLREQKLNQNIFKRLFSI